MSDFSLPTVDDLWSNIIAYLKNRDLDIAKGLDPANVTVTNPVTNMVRWNSANGYWEKYNGATWAALAVTYNINVSTLGGFAAALYAKLASPTFTGTVTVPTPAAADNSTKAASTAYVQTELAAKAPLASPALTGTPTAPTAAADATGTQLATLSFVLGQAAAAAPLMSGGAAVGVSTRFARADHVHPTDTTRAPLASPALTGAPTAPTAAPGTNTTQIATCAFVAAATGSLGTMSSQNANAVAITGGSIAGITDLAVADGGTGASTAAGAQTALDVPSRAGGGATGNWGISISGNAASATTAAACSGNAATVTTVTTSQVNGAIAGLTVGDVGTYAFCKGPDNLAPGATAAGSALDYSNAGAEITNTSLSGTWRCLGQTSNNVAGSDTTLFVRIS